MQGKAYWPFNRLNFNLPFETAIIKADAQFVNPNPFFRQLGILSQPLFNIAKSRYRLSAAIPNR
jgi:hypothetical protein